MVIFYCHRIGSERLANPREIVIWHFSVEEGIQLIMASHERKPFCDLRGGKTTPPRLKREGVEG
jgi:hypothetical protein